ncbi:hypothetical protein D3C85_1743480 [compost metagenome]
MMRCGEDGISTSPTTVETICVAFSCKAEASSGDGLSKGDEAVEPGEAAVAPSPSSSLVEPQAPRSKANTVIKTVK